ncbi:MAG: acetyl-CoA decarbonylase/synthase complex subunit gamma [Thermoplasmata archaeon]|nr:MAG: acetyl-CoA decarbonylase/synthase complex subunit gamma [Thermoplasmata archaeon]
MALTAIEIYKLLPKTNCGKCGVPTCLAFAMKLANKQAELSTCPDVSEDVKTQLEESAAPPIRLITVGVGDNAVEMGNETELFRHEKTFYHHTAFSVLIEDTASPEEISAKVTEANELEFERVGQSLKLSMLAVKATSGDSAQFAEAVKAVSSKTSLPLILMGDKPEVMEEALKSVKDNKPLIHAANKGNWEGMAALAKNHACPLVVYEDSGLDALAELTQNIKKAGCEDLMLDFGVKSLGESMRMLTIIRRLSAKKNFRPLGYPVILNLEGDPQKEGLAAAIYTMKYAAALIFNDIARWKMYPLVTLRQNIYTDPQIPIQVKPELYEINSPDENSPLLFTTNFSLTYFTVAGDIENSKIGSFLQVVDTEGLSVMTAFAAGKLTADSVVEALEKSGAKDKIKHNKIIIPGMVARMSAKLNEKSGREVLVGPRESSGIPKYLKSLAEG